MLGANPKHVFLKVCLSMKISDDLFYSFTTNYSILSYLSVKISDDLSLVIFTTNYPIYPSQMTFLMVFTPRFLLLHTSISFLHNSSLQKMSFITANCLIGCYMPGPSHPPHPPPLHATSWPSFSRNKHIVHHLLHFIANSAHSSTRKKSNTF